MEKIMQEIKEIYDRKYKQLFVLESGKVVSAYKSDVTMRDDESAYLKQQDINIDDVDFLL